MEDLTELPFQTPSPIHVKTLSGDIYVVELFPENTVIDLKRILYQENPQEWSLQSIRLYPSQSDTEADDDDFIDERGYNMLIDEKLFGVDLVILDQSDYERHTQAYLATFFDSKDWEAYTERAERCISMCGETIQVGDIVHIHYNEYSPPHCNTTTWYRIIRTDDNEWHRQIVVDSEDFPIEEWSGYAQENTTRTMEVYELIRYYCYEENRYKLCSDEEIIISQGYHGTLQVIPV